MATTSTKSRSDLYATVTATIVDELERGPEAWAQSWTLSVDAWCPRNHLTGNVYRGINLLLLAVACSKRGVLTNRWATFRQALAAGGAVRRSARGIPLVLFKPLDAKNVPVDRAESAADALESHQRVLVRHFHVFHISDCEGLPEAEHQPPANRSLAASIVRSSGARIVPGKPCYRPHEDIVQLPDPSSFDSLEHYYTTAYHELVHWSAPRVKRELAMKRFGDQAYAMEELVAELGAAMLCGAAGVPMISQCAAYLDSWLKVLRTDKRAIFGVAAQAQKAADYLLDAAAMAS